MTGSPVNWISINGRLVRELSRRVFWGISSGMMETPCPDGPDSLHLASDCVWDSETEDFTCTCAYCGGSFAVTSAEVAAAYAAWTENLPALAYLHSVAGSRDLVYKLVHRFFSKGESMRDRTQDDCDSAAYFIHSMHRKSLNYSTAQEAFERCVSML